jgi:hypothetical protein
VLGEQLLGGVQDLLHHFGALFRLADALAAGRTPLWRSRLLTSGFYFCEHASGSIFFVGRQQPIVSLPPRAPLQPLVAK